MRDQQLPKGSPRQTREDCEMEVVPVLLKRKSRGWGTASPWKELWREVTDQSSSPEEERDLDH